jgi:16S rRNA (guanine527-N7)-methyltransferase
MYDMIHVSRETASKLDIFRDTLLKWQSKINLISDISHLEERHFKDSIQLFSHLPHADISLLDMGTGAGFPGLVLAILGVKEVHLVESDTRKITFLREVARLTHTRVSLHNTRIESLPRHIFNVITSRALASLPQLLYYSYPHCDANTLCLFPKGKNHSIEIEDARREWEFDLSIQPSHTHPEGVILRIHSLRKKKDALQGSKSPL